MPRYAHIIGWGMSVPDKVLTNVDVSHMVDTSDEWIRSRPVSMSAESPPAKTPPAAALARRLLCKL